MYHHYLGRHPLHVWVHSDADIPQIVRFSRLQSRSHSEERLRLLLNVLRKLATQSGLQM